jgi:D-glycero-D-manno-heptose 1,7-bisphosphate phosphatase
VARGYFTSHDVDRFHEELQSQIQSELGFTLDGVYYCPHHPKGQVPEYAINCKCRKPGIALIDQAQNFFNIDLSLSAMVGDRASDIECGLNAGLKTIQIKSDQYEGHSTPDICVDNLNQAAQWLVDQA